MKIQLFMGEDKKFVRAIDGIVRGEFDEHLTDHVFLLPDEVITHSQEEPERFWTKDREYYWDVNSWVELYYAGVITDGYGEGDEV